MYQSMEPSTVVLTSTALSLPLVVRICDWAKLLFKRSTAEAGELRYFIPPSLHRPAKHGGG
jgi:hypothetical protein